MIAIDLRWNILNSILEYSPIQYEKEKMKLKTYVYPAKRKKKKKWE